MKSQSAIFTVILAFFAATSASAFTVSPKLGLMSGHEEITRQAIVWAQEILENDPRTKTEAFRLAENEMTDLEITLFGGLRGKSSSNPIVRGNYAMDVPENSRTPGWELQLAEFFRISPKEWHTDAATQPLHSLRKHVSRDEVESAAEACHNIQKSVVELTAEGMRHWQQFLALRTNRATQRDLDAQHLMKRKALFAFGAATHSLQDSFAPAHVFRATADDQRILDVCFYDPSEIKNGLRRRPEHALAGLGQTFWLSSKLSELIEKLIGETFNRFRTNQVCFHSTYDVRDGIWIRSQSDEALTRNQNWPAWESKFWDQIRRRNPNPIPVTACDYNFFSNEEERHQCLKHEARLARAATMKYLLTVTNMIFELRKSLVREAPGGRLIGLSDRQIQEEVKRRLTQHLFEGSDPYLDYLYQKLSDRGDAAGLYGLKDILPKGVLNCNGLSSQPQKMTF